MPCPDSRDYSGDRKFVVVEFTIGIASAPRGDANEISRIGRKSGWFYLGAKLVPKSDKKIVGKIRRWYAGRYIPPDFDPISDIVFLEARYERHWTARIARVLAQFGLREWKWIIGVAVAIAGLIFTKM